jgi:excisionase family DNA binding protein
MKVRNSARVFFAKQGETEMPEQTISTREAATALGVSIRHVLTLLYEEKLPGKKVGMVWRIPLSAVEQRLQRKRNA